MVQVSVHSRLLSRRSPLKTRPEASCVIGSTSPTDCFVMQTRLIVLALVLTANLGAAQIPYSGNDADHGVSRNNGLIDSYTGNLSFASHDLQVPGGVGARGFSWGRHANSRASQRDNFFGLGHNWTHSWQWEMTAVGRDDQGRALLVLREPQGRVHRFTEITPGQWQPAPSVKDRVVSNGDIFTVRRFDAGEVRFVRVQGVFTLDKIVDESGNVWTFSWEQGRLAQINEPAGRWIRISYGIFTSPSAPKKAASSTVITQVSASNGQTVSYGYEVFPDADYPVLTTVSYPDGTTARYKYAAPRRGDHLLLAQVSDPRCDSQLRGRVFHYRPESEAAAGQILKITTDGGDLLYSLEADIKVGERCYVVRKDNGATIYQKFNPGGNLTEEIDGSGFSTKSEYDAGGRGFLVATTDALGRVTRFENDALGNVLKTVFADGASKSWQRDDRGRVLVEIDELGHTRRYFRDGRGRVIRVENPDDSSEEMTYNEFGQLLTHKDRGGAVTTMTYDARGLRIQVANALGASTTRIYNSEDRVASITDPRGNTTRYERNRAGRVTKTIYADGASTSAVYDDFGQATRIIDATGAVRTVEYDEFGRHTTTIDAKGERSETFYSKPGENAPFNRPIGSATPSGRLTSISYDAAGRVVGRIAAADTAVAAATRTAYDAAGRQISITNPLGKTLQYFYDERGRRIKTMSSLKNATSATYDAAGRKISQTDAKGNTTRWTYDAMGRELTKTDAKGQVTRREYNSAGRLTAVIDAKLNIYRFEYDLLGRQIALVYPDGSRETAGYDAAGLRVSTTNRAGTTRTFAYDNRNREISSEWSDGSQRIVKAYDIAGRMTLEDNGISRLAFSYDEAGRLASETQDLSPVVSDGTSDPDARTVSYTYNADGQRETLGYPDGGFIKFTYNDRGQLAEILGDGVQPPIASYEYDEAGNAARMPRENETATEKEFDAENKTLAITERATGLNNPLSELDYLYDEVGNRTATLATHDRDGDGTAEARLDTYRYDETYQVTGADYNAPVTGIVPPAPSADAGVPAANISFTYDAVGNRLAVDDNGAITRYAVNNLNQYIKVGEFAPTYDRNGNLSGMGTWLYRYDAINRLVFASNGTTTARFFYDAKNRCVARSYQHTGAGLKAPSSALTLNTYDNWSMIEERDSTGAQRARYVHGRGIDEIIVIVNQNGTFYPHHDVLGNVTMLTDRHGRLVERYTYSVSGQVAISDMAGQVLPRSAVGNRWMFTGREWLQEVGLYDYRNRVYSGELGRFLQTDPIRFSAGDINIYRYCGNGYVSRIDSDGRAWSWAAMGLGAAAGAVGSYINEVADLAFYNDPIDWQEIVEDTISGAIAGAIVGAVTGDPSAAAVFWTVGGAFFGGMVTGAIPDDILGWLSNDPDPDSYMTYGPLNCHAYEDPVSDTWIPWE